MIPQKAILGGLLASLMLVLVCGCSGSTPAEASTNNSTACICTETNEVFAADKLAPKNMNPKTGRATLVPALFCDRCQKWYPAPPLETLQRKPGASLCPVNGTPMTLSGPIPTPSAN